MKDKEILNLPAVGSFTVDPNGKTINDYIKYETNLPAGDYKLIAVPANCEVSNE